MEFTNLFSFSTKITVIKTVPAVHETLLIGVDGEDISVA